MKKGVERECLLLFASNLMVRVFTQPLTYLEEGYSKNTSKPLLKVVYLPPMLVHVGIWNGSILEDAIKYLLAPILGAIGIVGSVVRAFA